MKSIESMLQGFTEKELTEWAGSTICLRGKAYVDDVSELSRTDDGRLVAYVSGSHEYVTTVRRDGKGAFDYTCTCPYEYGGPCKHVVAVLLAAMEQVQQHEEIPLLDPDDDLYLELSDYLEDEADEAEEGEIGNSSPAKSEAVSKEIVAMLAEKSRDELFEILTGVVRHFPPVATWLQERDQLASGKIDKLVRSLRKEIRNLTAIDAWPVDGDYFEDSPDYSGVQQRFQALLDGGHADAVFELGEELWERGTGQVESFEDEGETAAGINACMRIVLKALPRTKLSRLEQLVWLYDRLREDQFDLLDGSAEFLDNAGYGAEDWRELASALEERLGKMAVPRPDRLDQHYQRRHLIDQLTDVYRRAQEPEKVIPLLEKEAEPCFLYDALVKELLAAGQVERARFWCIEGYGKTKEGAPGIASVLRQHLVNLAQTEGKADIVAAYRAQDFFRYPSVGAFSTLRDAAEKIGLWPAVRDAAFEYLQKGKLPFDSAKRRDTWPLPEPEAGQVRKPQTAGSKAFPMLAVLIEIAILEERHDDVIALFQELSQTNRCGRDISEKVAEAVKTSYPETSLKIWRSTVDTLIAEVKPSAYEEASGYLRKMHAVYRQTDRLAEWSAMIAELRVRHKAKRRLMEVLKAVEKEDAPLTS